MMSKEKKQVYISEMSSQLDKAEAVIVAHYQGLTVKQLDELRKKMREHGIQSVSYTHLTLPTILLV